MKKEILFLLALIILSTISCKKTITEYDQKNNEELSAIDTEYDSIVYQTEYLIINKLSNHVYQHRSFLKTDEYGKVSCNGMFIINTSEAIIFDSPTDDIGASELIKFITNKLKSKINAIIPTHFHEDCIGGLKEFEKDHISIYASLKTLALLNKNEADFSNSINGFKDHLTLNLGDEKVYANYFGAGHTQDNIIGYFPKDNAVFGGCLIKSIGASKGYLGDANIKEWSKTVRKLKTKYPTAKIVIPGHGKWGNHKLFDYTIELFE